MCVFDIQMNVLLIWRYVSSMTVVINKLDASNVQLSAELIRRINATKRSNGRVPIDYQFFFFYNRLLVTVGTNTSKAFNIPIVVEYALVRSVSHNRGRKEVMASVPLCFAAQSRRAPWYSLRWKIDYRRDRIDLCSPHLISQTHSKQGVMLWNVRIIRTLLTRDYRIYFNLIL